MGVDRQAERWSRDKMPTGAPASRTSRSRSPTRTTPAPPRPPWRRPIRAEVASLRREEHGSTITLLYVADARAARMEFLAGWAESHGLDVAHLRVESGPVDAAIVEAAAEATMVIAGASERGLLSRLVRGTPVLGIVDEDDCSVLLAERAHRRGCIQRLFGR